MAHLDQAKRRHETQAKLRQLAGADRAQLLRRHGFYVRLLEDFGPRPLERSEIEQVGPRAFSRPAAQESGQLATQLGERRVTRWMLPQIVLGHGVERPSAEHPRELGKIVAQSVDLPPDEHVGVDPDPRAGIELRRSSEEQRRIDRLASRRAGGELVEEPLHLGELHDATARRTSASMAAALRLSPTSTSSSGMWSSHSISAGTGPNRVTAIR